MGSFLVYMLAYVISYNIPYPLIIIYFPQAKIKSPGDELEELMNDNRRLKRDNVTLQKYCDEQKRIIERQKVEMESLHCLNTDSLRISVDLENEVISSWHELCGKIYNLHSIY